ncbi:MULTISPECIES: Flp family type IVb pilin [Ensifer]|jgi:pilus assembly protein Flp/PilA|uniref:Flp family type IVb pilin n=1 Tax=Ensifer canadensis TaxID=555315 RepID=A0AAW4FVB2_9HYPH|nr:MULTISPECIES: Flp family type IVb pilin [Ensifer]MDP9634779.1 pilus assembly protein Flp/PilA [Ensifer adhaerens]MBD9492041.1 Flp family type IVb pilin [Ensifer sp. ENS11]MBM3095259.1 Flp family type IVb pilin [Ensifer canadensis]NOV20554.1 Flp family type IVb pilin [Ensifer canadensis]OMQ37812.1 pilin [Ensifer sp. 1H6]
MDTLKRLIRDRSAATAIEYGLIAAIISVSLLLGMEQIQAALTAIFELLTTTFQNAMS